MGVGGVCGGGYLFILLILIVGGGFGCSGEGGGLFVFGFRFVWEILIVIEKLGVWGEERF